MFFDKNKRRNEFLGSKTVDFELKTMLDQLVDTYNSVNETSNFQLKWNTFKECHKAICELYKDGKVYIYAGDCEFDYLITLLENDGPQYTAIIIFGIEGNCFYEIGVCVRGTPLLKKISIDDKGTQKTIKSMWGKLGIFFTK